MEIMEESNYDAMAMVSSCHRVLEPWKIDLVDLLVVLLLNCFILLWIFSA